jgi:hypothetical protein
VRTLSTAGGEKRLAVQRQQPLAGGRSLTGQFVGAPGASEATPGGGDGAGHFKKSCGHPLTASVAERCRFIQEQEKDYPIQVLCKVMQISRSAYYQYLTPKAFNAETQQVEEKLTAVFRAHKRRYGVRRICAELKEQQIRVGKHKCRRIMKKFGLKAIQPRSFVPRTTQT